ncbi:hypothetical protein ACQY0O_001287 [Thecaphora frezii]
MMSLGNAHLNGSGQENDSKLPEVVARLETLTCKGKEAALSARSSEKAGLSSRAGSPSAFSSASRTSTSDSVAQGTGFADRVHLHSSGSEISSASHQSQDGCYERTLSDQEDSSRLWLGPATEWKARKLEVQPLSAAEDIGLATRAAPSTIDSPILRPLASSGMLRAGSTTSSGRHRKLSDSPEPRRCGEGPGAGRGRDINAAPVAASRPTSPDEVSAGRAERSSSGPSRSDVRRLAVPIRADELLCRLRAASWGSYAPACTSRLEGTTSRPLAAVGAQQPAASHEQRASQHRVSEVPSARTSAPLLKKSPTDRRAPRNPSQTLDGGGTTWGSTRTSTTATPIACPVSSSGTYDPSRASMSSSTETRSYQPHNSNACCRPPTDDATIPVPSGDLAAAAAGGQTRSPTWRKPDFKIVSISPEVELPPPCRLDTATDPHAAAWRDRWPENFNPSSAATTAAAARHPPSPLSGHRFSDEKRPADNHGRDSSSLLSPSPSSPCRDLAQLGLGDSPAFASPRPQPSPSPPPPSSASTVTPNSTFQQLHSPAKAELAPTHRPPTLDKAPRSYQPSYAISQPPSTPSGPNLLALPFDATSTIPPLIIDARPLDAFLASEHSSATYSTTVTGRVRSSINVSLPKLILRRLSRSCSSEAGTHISLPLKSFISTRMGKRRFSEVLDAVARGKAALKRQHLPPLEPGHPAPLNNLASTQLNETEATSQDISQQPPDHDSFYWKADIVVLYDRQQEAPSHEGKIRGKGNIDPNRGTAGEILIKTLERVGPRDATDRGGGVYFVKSTMAELKAELGAEYWLDSREEGVELPTSRPNPASPVPLLRQNEPVVARHHRQGPGRSLSSATRGRATVPSSPALAVNGSQIATSSLLPFPPADAQGTLRRSPMSATSRASLPPSPVNLSVPYPYDATGLSPPPSLSPVLSPTYTGSSRPKRPSLARLDTSERIKLADASAEPGQAVPPKKSPNAMRLFVDTAMPRRSATLSGHESSSRNVSRNASPKTPSIGLVCPPENTDRDVPPTPATAQSLQSLCKKQSQQPSLASSLEDMCLLSGARDTFEFGEQASNAAPPHSASPDFEISTILPGFLYLGPNIQTRDDVEELRRRGVKRILNMAYEIEEGGAELQLDSSFQKYLKIPMTDSVEAVGVQKSIEEACRFLDDARLHSSPTYVHCKAGKSRSVTIVMAFLIHANHWTLRKSYNFVVERRNAISPNIGFVAELMKFEERELNLSKSGGIIGGNMDDSDNDDACSSSAAAAAGGATAGEARRPEDEASRKTKARESMPALSRETLASLSCFASPKSTLASLHPDDGGGGGKVDDDDRRARGAHRPTAGSASSSSKVTVTPSLGYIDSMAGLGGMERQIKMAEADVETEVRGSDGRYRSRRPPPVDEVHLAPGRRATMAGLGK